MMFSFLILVVFQMILNSQITYSLFTSLDCTFGSLFNKTTCSWIINSKLDLDDQGLMVSSGSQKHFRKIDDVLTLLTSPQIDPNLIKNSKTCSIELNLYSESAFDGYQLNWLLKEQNPNAGPTYQDLHRIDSGFFNKGSIKKINIGRPKKPFQLELELMRADRKKPNTNWKLYIREVRFVDCGRDSSHGIEDCILRCDENRCISRDEICDVSTQCNNGIDEKQNCSALPNGAYLSYTDGNLDEYDWTNYGTNKWLVKNGSVISKFSSNSKADAIMQSPIFKSINFEHRQRDSSNFNACKLRFYHWIDFANAELTVSILEFETADGNRIENSNMHQIDRINVKKEYELYHQFQQKPDTHWTFSSIPLPQTLFGSYRLKFVGANPLAMPISREGSIRVANLSLSKDCFSQEPVPPESKLKEYYELLRLPKFSQNIKGIRFNSCGQSGPVGPNTAQCLPFYGINSSIQVIDRGIQTWRAPKSAYYSIFLSGASGGNGYHSLGGRGAFVRAIVHLEENERLIILVGQSGESSCFKSQQLNKVCGHESTFLGSGGGGASYVFTLGTDIKNDQLNDNQARSALSELNENNLLLVASGAGGSGSSRNSAKSSGENGLFFNQFIDHTNRSMTNWQNSTLRSLLNSNETFAADCKGQSQRLGGFPGGLKGCRHGGSGDGFTVFSNNIEFDSGGTGGTSFFDKDRVHLTAFSLQATNNEDYYFATKSLQKSDHPESGEWISEQFNGFVVIYEQIDHCCQEYPCVVVGSDDLKNANVLCACSFTSFQPNTCPSIVVRILLVLAILVLSVILVIFGYLLYRRHKLQIKNQRQFNSSSDNALCLRDRSTSNLISNSNSTELQLRSLRNNTIVSEFNPNYLFGQDEICALRIALQHLKQIPHQEIELVRALGKGAFGEVYQGIYKKTDEKGDKMPIDVAVKTLPEFSSSKKSEIDFIMEALVMASHDHRNIVRLIGVSFDKMPRLIILELLIGGDLKTFLRENRGTSQRNSILNMGDLIVFALDIARGCEYLEEHRFIHRDLSARNCLLTNKVKKLSSLINQRPNIEQLFDIEKYSNGFNNSGIVAKIADFGLARDIYRNDYYKKGGCACLPVKWMPPEAIIDGVFTNKTDVWSYGILLWEIFSFGFMPYPGRNNQEVMQFVVSGGRPDPISAMPDQIWRLLEWCLEGNANKRPSFKQVIQVLGQCLTDKEILFREVTLFTSQTSSQSGNASNETTVTKPADEFNSYLRPLIPPGNRLEFLNRQRQRNKSIATIDTNSPGTNTCSTVTTIVYSSNQSQSNDSNTSALRSIGLDGSISPISGLPSRPQSASGIRRIRRGSRLTDNILENDTIEEKSEEQKLADKQRLNDQLNKQFNEQVNEHFSEKHRPFITKISGPSLNKLSEIFRTKDNSNVVKDCKPVKEISQGSNKDSIRSSKQTNSVKNNFLNKLDAQSTEVIDFKPTQSSGQLSTNEINNQAVNDQPTKNGMELILSANTLNGHSCENTNASFLQTTI